VENLMMRKRAAWIMPLLITLFLPVALLGLLFSVNEYRDQGIGGAVDCNGPLTVMLFVVPSLVVYAAGAIYYAMLLKGVGRSWRAVVLMVLCLGMTLASGAKAWAAYQEQIRPEYQQTCRGEW
jgi:hypothetical protein